MNCVLFIQRKNTDAPCRAPGMFQPDSPRAEPTRVEPSRTERSQSSPNFQRRRLWSDPVDYLWGSAPAVPVNASTQNSEDRWFEYAVSIGIFSACIPLEGRQASP
jgi:hypothetical protein